VVLVDAMPRGGTPGTLYVLEPEPVSGDDLETIPLLDAHSLDLARVLRLVASLGGRVANLVVVGCEPEAAGTDEDSLAEMSAAVRAAVNEAVLLVESLVGRLLGSSEPEAQATDRAVPGHTIPAKEVPTCHP
jgi:hydrogenase maturation protease